MGMPRIWDGSGFCFRWPFFILLLSVGCGPLPFSLLCSYPRACGVCSVVCVSVYSVDVTLFLLHAALMHTIHSLVRTNRPLFFCTKVPRPRFRLLLVPFHKSRPFRCGRLSERDSLTLHLPSRLRLSRDLSARRAPAAAGALLGACFRGTDGLVSRVMAIVRTNAAAETFWVAAA